MAAGKINLQKASGGITTITGVDGTGNTELVLPESGTVATTAGATETSNGLIELATTAETQAGTDDTRAITPLKLKNSVIGLGQTWQDVTGSRVVGTTYTNSTGKPIKVLITIQYYADSNIRYANFNVGGVITAKYQLQSNSTGQFSMPTSIVIPSGAQYSFTTTWGLHILHWSELR